ncbi:alpha-ribazole phosphatase [Sagittula marina]|uniref:Alpha-ribazole phosphatase n=1 Tax=Sagittula marina TaxID=943940 RepID=A0A7W6DS64_9RHOB|nr:histidine phosphatase family protein [Sagittula marina]MBB3985917.1 alpha-ribazole phosphatase [Sagittula marina]
MTDRRPELVLIRHAPVAVPGRLAGRTDFPARLDPEAVARLQGLLPDVAAVISSPAQRCVTTAAAVFSGADVATDERLWEQDFGTYDGALLADLPDLGALSSEALAAHRWPEGESFSTVSSRVAPALSDAAMRAQTEGAVAVVAHAGVIRAALALVLGHVPGALAFEIAPLSVTRLGVWEGRPVSIRQVNGGGL